MNSMPNIMLELEIVKDINSVLNKYNISINYSDLVITDTNIMETIVKDKHCTFTGQQIKESDFSKKIIEMLFPSEATKIVYHYTTKETAENIINNESFRLYNIAKRISEDEISSFCKAHCLANDNIMIPSTFYSSFTSTKLTPKKDDYLWENFAVHDGVRLEMSIATSKLNRTDILRKIYYEKTDDSSPIPILRDLAEVANKYDKKFTLKGISTICSYYLPNDYDIEDEYRIVHRNIDGRLLPVKSDSKGDDYIQIPLDEENNTGYFIKIKGVTYTTSINVGNKYKTYKRNN